MTQTINAVSDLDTYLNIVCVAGNFCRTGLNRHIQEGKHDTTGRIQQSVGAVLIVRVTIAETGGTDRGLAVQVGIAVWRVDKTAFY